MNFIERANQVAEPKPKRKAKRSKTPSKSPWWTSFSAFIDGPMKHLPPAPLKVWLYLLRNSRHWRASETERQIANGCGISERAVRTAIRHLEGVDLLTVESVGNRNKGPSRYRLLPVSTGSQLPAEHESQTEASFRLTEFSTGSVLPTATGSVLPPPHEKQCDAPLVAAIAMNGSAHK